MLGYSWLSYELIWAVVATVLFLIAILQLNRLQQGGCFADLTKINREATFWASLTEGLINPKDFETIRVMIMLGYEIPATDTTFFPYTLSQVSERLIQFSQNPENTTLEWELSSCASSLARQAEAGSAMKDIAVTLQSRIDKIKATQTG